MIIIIVTIAVIIVVVDAVGIYTVTRCNVSDSSITVHKRVEIVIHSSVHNVAVVASTDVVMVDIVVERLKRRFRQRKRQGKRQMHRRVSVRQ